MQSDTDIIRMGKKGVFVIPAYLREQYGLNEGSLVIPEPTENGIILKPATVLPIEIYTPERRAEFLLSNATNEQEYQEARQDVQNIGLNPNSIPHTKPGSPDAPAVS